MARAAITNGKLLPGVDGPSSHTRRYRDLCAEFAQHIAGGEELSPRILGKLDAKRRKREPLNRISETLARNVCSAISSETESGCQKIMR
jgi:hypothetical protein